ncbi:MAG: hypothetical protein A2X48_24395 [Lentisphaerae bacterium GWF2_49_21]|nr:MAG: hypothetical protein A2X48_24395 [Lentisphaerae bacterium GWF2_49_21]
MRWPGQIPAGVVNKELASTLDFLPTFAKLASADLPKGKKIDGYDIWPLMSGQQGAKTPYENFFFWRNDKVQAVRQGQWKFRMLTKHSIELYNLDNDIGEATNVADKYPEIVKKLKQAIDNHQQELMPIDKK